MPLSRPALMILAAVLTLAACGPAPKASSPPAEPPPVTPAPASGVPTLSVLTEADLAANGLGGELACGFSTAAGTVLLAKGMVASKEPAQGLVKADGVVERLTAPGGFDGMLKGASFIGDRSTVTVTVTGPSTGGGESPPSPAELNYLRTDGQSVTLAGSWTCGP